MYSFFVLVAVLVIGIGWPVAIEIADALAQAPIAAPTLAPDVQNLVNQIHQVGCQAEENASAQTIAQLQKENASLKAQIQKLDPPKSGATKH